MPRSEAGQPRIRARQNRADRDWFIAGEDEFAKDSQVDAANARRGCNNDWSALTGACSCSLTHAESPSSSRLNDQPSGSGSVTWVTASVDKSGCVTVVTLVTLSRDKAGRYLAHASWKS